MSKDGYYGDFGSFAEEQRQYELHMASQVQEPNVVPCFKCGAAYRGDVSPKGQIALSGAFFFMW